MYCIRNINQDVVYVGASDRRLELFENAFPIPNGVSYNSYIINDEKTVLLDTVDSSVSDIFIENVDAALNQRKLDYVIVNHMEPDHCATLARIIKLYPEAIIVGNAKTIQMIGQFFDCNIESRIQVVKEGDTLNTGRHNFTFVMAPMVHWPEVMVTFDSTDGILYSADAFGTFGALAGNIFDNELDFAKEWPDEARRYYTNIVGKYGLQVQALLKKAAALDIKIIAPLHGQIIRDNAAMCIDLYSKWSSYTPELDSALIVYASIYGNTENAVNILAAELASNGMKSIEMYDVSKTHVSYLVSEAFKYSKIVLASPTYNNGIFPAMENFLLDLKAHNFCNRKIAIIENGSWGPMSGKLMTEIVSSMKNMDIVGDKLTVKSSVKEEQRTQLLELASILR